ncbi:hypothetical protein B0T24DRAFT_676352 [Lasiosphaeria ovina]|uniref:Uncharacterized protein n=1 Tax=Lasiosphaeria ovina TaxID=92902 RepID=A0AAE0NFU5_9PEZI|nr:hypothetical protein B0T24DRAFT_676352 [Lasiosphaeria ovina]
MAHTYRYRHNFSANASVTRYLFGPLYGNRSFTYQASNDAYTNGNVYQAAAPYPEYGMGVRRAYYANGIIVPTWSVFTPIAELSVANNDADLTLMLTAANAFRATTAIGARVPAAGMTPGTEYGQDRPGAPLVCLERYQFCASEKCTRLRGLWDLAQDLALMFDRDEDAQNRLHWLSAITGTANANMAEMAIRADLLARASLRGGFQAALPDGQWQLEMQYWFATTLAAVQRAFVDVAAGPSASGGGGDDGVPESALTRPANAEERALCAGQRMLSPYHVSFSLFGLLFVLVFGLVVIVVSANGEAVAAACCWCCRERRKGAAASPARLEWAPNDTLQLQRLAHEQLGVGPWKGAVDAVPVVVGQTGGASMGVLDMTDARPPRLRAPVDDVERDLSRLATEEKVPVESSEAMVTLKKEDDRHYPFIDIQSGQQLSVEDQADHGKDLKEYIEKRLRVAGTGTQAQDIRAELCRKSSGIFMWVVLVWILYSRYPLRREEFYFAVVSGLDPSPEDLVWNKDFVTPDMMDRFILNSSRGLAEVTKSDPHLSEATVQFIHESVRDFLVKDGGMHQLWPESRDDPDSSISHDRLKHCCSVYLGAVDASNTANLPVHDNHSFPFFGYASGNVLYHANEAVSGIPQDGFLKGPNIASCILRRNLGVFDILRQNAPPDSTLFYVLAERGLSRLLLTARGWCDPWARLPHEMYPYALYAALTAGHRDAVRVILQQDGKKPRPGDADDDISATLPYGVETFDLHAHDGLRNQTPLWWAVRSGNVAVARLLLNRGANPDVQGDENDDAEGDNMSVDTDDSLPWDRFDILHSTTPLTQAAGDGNEALVRLLLDRGANFSAADRSGQTPLVGAVENSRAANVRLLLDQGADPNGRNKRGQTPLIVAHDNAITHLLLEREAETNARDHQGSSALMVAARSGNVARLRLLLDHGAKIDTEKQSMSYENSPLILASRGGWDASVQLLLDRGAFVDVRDCNGRTPLWNAASLGHRDVAKLLLDSGADVDSKDSGGHTPLWAACTSLVKNEVGETTGIHVPLDRIANADSINTYAGDVDAGGGASAADIDRTGDQYCAPPSPAAASHRHMGVLKLLLEGGADRQSMLLNAVIQVFMASKS